MASAVNDIVSLGFAHAFCVRVARANVTHATMGCPIGFNASDPASFPTPPIVELTHSLPLPHATFDPDAVLNFVHVPKTGGSSLERCLQNWCARNEARCFHTFHHARPPGTWLGARTTARNGLDQLRALTQGERDEIRVVYGHQESGVQELFARPVHSVAVLREPTERWFSELAFVTRHTRVGPVPPECLPRDEMATYLCYGSDFRKGEIVPPEELRTEAHYAQRRAPTVPQLHDCLRRYVKLLTIETDGHFDAVGKLLELRFPYLTAKFECNENKNVSPRAQKAALRTNRSSDAFADAMQRMNALDLALWRHVRDHGSLYP